MPLLNPLAVQLIQLFGSVDRCVLETMAQKACLIVTCLIAVILAVLGIVVLKIGPNVLKNFVESVSLPN